ncbi:MAG: class I SAM-dependent methyltransferase, partial [Caldilineae bacterium]
MTAAARTWDAWRGNRKYGELMRRRALGMEPEMESAKQLVRLLEPSFRPGMHVLDVGCGAGHFVRSLKRLDPQVHYTGVDFTGYYLAVAQDVWQDDPRVRFICGDAFNLPVASGGFDVVTCVTVLQNLPDYRAPFQELLRASRRMVLVRMLLGEITHIIHRYENPRQPDAFTYYNIWSTDEVVDFIKSQGARQVEVL